MSLSSQLFLLSSSFDHSYTCLKVKKKNGVTALKKRALPSRFAHRILHRQKDLKEVKKFCEETYESFTKLDRKAFVADSGEVTELFIAAQRYNQTLTRHQKTHKNALLNKFKLESLSNPNLPEIEPVALAAGKTFSKVEGDRPKIHFERRFLIKKRVQRYPGDDLDHGK